MASLPVCPQTPGTEIGAPHAIAAQVGELLPVMAPASVLNIDPVVEHHAANPLFPSGRRIPVFVDVVAIGLWHRDKQGILTQLSPDHQAVEHPQVIATLAIFCCCQLGKLGLF